jgi:hypothetical protein
MRRIATLVVAGAFAVGLAGGAAAQGNTPSTGRFKSWQEYCSWKYTGRAQASAARGRVPVEQIEACVRSKGPA